MNLVIPAELKKHADEMERQHLRAIDEFEEARLLMEATRLMYVKARLDYLDASVRGVS